MNLFKRKIEVSSVYAALLFKYVLALIFLLVTQWIFFLLNRSFFSVASFGEFLSILAGSVRYALATTTVFLLPFILLNILPFEFRGKRIYRSVSNVFYYAGSILPMAVNIGDIVYYRFTFRRMAGDIFNYLSVGGDFKELIPQFVQDFWSYVLMFIVLVVILIWIGNKITWQKKSYQIGRAHV